MQWYKHDTNAHGDARLKRVRMKYGMEGYGLYWYCLELIAANIDQNNLSFELDHDAELISHDTGIHYERIQEMMTYMIDLELFESSGGKITCLKMLRRLDQSMTSHSGMRALIAQAKKTQNHDSVMIGSDLIMQEENRIEENRTEKKKTLVRYAHGFNEFWQAYPKKRNKKKALDIWKRKRLHTKAVDLVQDVFNRISHDKRWLDGYIPDPTTYLNQERWDDELDDVTRRSGGKLTYAEQLAEDMKNADIQ